MNGKESGGSAGIGPASARKPERTGTNRRLISERRLSRISDNFNDDDLSDSFKDFDDNDKNGKYQKSA